MKKFVFVVEIKDKREEMLLKSLQSENCVCVTFGQESYFKELKKVYLFSLSTNLNEQTVEALEDGSVVFTRSAPALTEETFAKKNIKAFDYMDDEEFVYKNAKLTAEGAISHIITNTEMSFEDMKVLVVGAGRVGKSLLLYLRNNGAKAHTATDDNAELAYGAAFSECAYKLCELKHRISEYDVIINTIPKTILKGDILRHADKNCFILDLASKPGGIDFSKAKDLELKVLHALGVPGKTAPKTAANYLKDSVLKRLSTIYNER